MQLPAKWQHTTLHPKKSRDKMTQVAGDIPLLKIPKQLDQVGKFGDVLARPFSVCFRMNERIQKGREIKSENNLCSCNLQLSS